ncbi:MAG: calcium-binding protein [Gammaproteobacteria bacterium]|nr:calcium-binding protein [Gammaproteobacteria bacterium]
MAITAEARTEIIQLVVGMFGAAPGASVLSDLVAAKEAGQTVKQIAANVANTNEFKSIYPTFLTNQEFAERFVNNLVGSEVAAADKAAAVTILVGQLNAGATRSNVVVDAINAVKAVPSTNTAWANAAAALANKVTVATYYSVEKQLSGTTLAGLQNVIATVTSTAASVTAANAVVDGQFNVGQTFTLTTGADTFNGGAAVDTFNAVEINSTATGPTWTVGDAINGGAGNDTLNITQTTAITQPLSATVVNVETAKAVSGAAVTLDTTTWTGLTSLNTTSAVDATLTAAATADVSATVSGVTAASNITVNGGKNVTVALSGSATDGDVGAELTIGGTTVPAGAITVTNTNSAAVDQADVTITGGTSVTVTESLTNAVATTGTQGDVVVTGGTATTAVTVNQDKAATAAAAVVGKVNGAVTINDKNAASASTAGVISTVSLSSYGTSTIDSSAIATVNLAGTGGALTITRGALTAVPTANTLALNLNGLSGAAASITDGEAAADDGFTTVNITSSTAASTVADLVVADATTINVAGDAKVTFTANTGFGAVTAVTVTNTAGSSFGTALATGVLFTGGAGADTLILTDEFTKAITLGAGDDKVTIVDTDADGVLAGTGGTVAAGDGTDTIVLTSTTADAIDGNSTFNTKFTGFEVLDIATGGAAATVNLAGINGVSKVVTRGAAGVLTLDGFATGGTLTLDADVGAGSYVANVTNAVLTAGDTFNVSLSTAAAAAIGFGSVTLAGIETVNIATVDASTASAATIGTATLVATAATKVVVTGNNGLTLTNTGNTVITTFDASGVVGNSTSTAVDTAANLGVTFTSANVTTTATVTITGGAGNDTLSGAAAKDTINGGAGADTVSGGLGVDTITVGEGRDIVVVNSTAGTSTDSGTAAFDSVTGFKVSEVISTAVDLSSNALFKAATAGGVNASLLNLDVDAAAADQAIAIEPTATTLAGQAVGVTYSVSSRGILTLSGTGASAVDTLAEWLTEASAVAATLGDILAFEFGGDTYVFAENAAQDVLVKLVGVTGATGLVEVSAATTSTVAGAILYADIG